jgi:hypothetical protein
MTWVTVLEDVQIRSLGQMSPKPNQSDLLSLFVGDPQIAQASPSIRECHEFLPLLHAAQELRQVLDLDKQATPGRVARTAKETR